MPQLLHCQRLRSNRITKTFESITLQFHESLRFSSFSKTRFAKTGTPKCDDGPRPRVVRARARAPSSPHVYLQSPDSTKRRRVVKLFHELAAIASHQSGKRNENAQRRFADGHGFFFFPGCQRRYCDCVGWSRVQFKSLSRDISSTLMPTSWFASKIRRRSLNETVSPPEVTDPLPRMFSVYSTYSCPTDTHVNYIYAWDAGISRV